VSMEVVLMAPAPGSFPREGGNYCA
jgi:hypothetical protein